MQFFLFLAGLLFLFLLFYKGKPIKVMLSSSLFRFREYICFLHVIKELCQRILSDVISALETGTVYPLRSVSSHYNLNLDSLASYNSLLCIQKRFKIPSPAPAVR